VICRMTSVACGKGLAVRTWIYAVVLLGAAVSMPVVGFGLCVPDCCQGDCDGSGDVTVNEIITLVDIALDQAPASTCPFAGTQAPDDPITILQIIKAVVFALDGCPAA